VQQDLISGFMYTRIDFGGPIEKLSGLTKAIN
jgi:hypothetical protein